MYTFEVHGGDFGDGYAMLCNNKFSLPVAGRQFSVQDVPSSLLSSVEVLTEDSVKTKGIGTGLAGAALPVPVGLLAGLFIGSKTTKRIVFTIHFQDGRKMLVTGDSSALVGIQTALSNAPAAYESSLKPVPSVQQAPPKMGPIDAVAALFFLAVIGLVIVAGGLALYRGAFGSQGVKKGNSNAITQEQSADLNPFPVRPYDQPRSGNIDVIPCREEKGFKDLFGYLFEIKPSFCAAPGVFC